MRSTRLLALAAIAALPFAAAPAPAAPAGPQAAGTLAKSSTASQVIDVQHRGGHIRGGGGLKGGSAFRGGGGPKFGMRGGRPGHGHFRPGRGLGKHGFRHHRHHHHFHHRHRPRWYGVPAYYYGGYYPDAYYYDDYYYDDGPDETVVYADSDDAVARCEARYKSFDRASGTFMSNEGVRKLCPYLR